MAVALQSAVELISNLTAIKSSFCATSENFSIFLQYLLLVNALDKNDGCQLHEESKGEIFTT